MPGRENKPAGLCSQLPELGLDVVPAAKAEVWWLWRLCC